MVMRKKMYRYMAPLLMSAAVVLGGCGASSASEDDRPLRSQQESSREEETSATEDTQAQDTEAKDAQAQDTETKDAQAQNADTQNPEALDPEKEAAENTSETGEQAANDQEEGKETDLTVSGISFETVDIYGNAVTQDILAQADITVVNLWATYCGPCINEMPELAEWCEEMPDNVQIIGVVSDIGGVSDAYYIGQARTIVENTGADVYPHLILTRGGLLDLVIDAYAVPTTYFLDSNGVEITEPVVGAYVDGYKKIVNEYVNSLE